MKTLLEHNKEILNKGDTSKSKLNGIECPNCKKELFDVNGILMGHSFANSDMFVEFQYLHIHCKCGYYGIRLATSDDNY